MMEALQQSLNPDGNMGTPRADAAFFDAVNSGPYIGGMPVGLSRVAGAGYLAGAAAATPTVSAVDSNNIQGLLWNNSVIDTNRGGGTRGVLTDLTVAIPTVVITPAKVHLFAGTPQNDASVTSTGGFTGGAPFIVGDAWVVGDNVYISSGAAANAGRWTRTAGAANYARPWGRVSEVSVSGGVTTDLKVEFFAFVPGAATTVIIT